MGRDPGALSKIIVAAMFAILPLALGSCGTGGSETVTYVDKNTMKDPVTKDTDFKPMVVGFYRNTLGNDGRKIWELRGKYAQQLKADELYDINEPMLIHYDKTGKKVISGEHGIYYQKEKKIFLEGKVLMKSYNFEKPENNYNVKTDEVFWMQNEGLIETEKPVELINEGLRIKGMGFRTFTNSHKIEIKKNISVTIEQSASKLSEK